MNVLCFRLKENRTPTKWIFFPSGSFCLSCSSRLTLKWREWKRWWRSETELSPWDSRGSLQLRCAHFHFCCIPCHQKRHHIYLLCSSKQKYKLCLSAVRPCATNATSERGIPSQHQGHFQGPAAERFRGDEAGSCENTFRSENDLHVKFQQRGNVAMNTGKTFITVIALWSNRRAKLRSAVSTAACPLQHRLCAIILFVFVRTVFCLFQSWFCCVMWKELTKNGVSDSFGHSEGNWGGTCSCFVMHRFKTATRLPLAQLKHAAPLIPLCFVCVCVWGGERTVFCCGNDIEWVRFCGGLFAVVGTGHTHTRSVFKLFLRETRFLKNCVTVLFSE